MVALGTDAGVRTVALITDMSTPARADRRQRPGGAESVEVLAGGGPADVVELTLALAREMLAAAGPRRRRPGRRAARRPGDGRVAADDRRPGRRPRRATAGGPRDSRPSRPPRTASSSASTRWPSGVAAWRLGAGGARKEDPVQAAAGVELHAKPGAFVRAGEPLLTLHTDEPERFEPALAELAGAFDVAPEGARPPDAALVLDRVGCAAVAGVARQPAPSQRLRQGRRTRPALLDGQRADGARVGPDRAGLRRRRRGPDVGRPHRGAVAPAGRRGHRPVRARRAARRRGHSRVAPA